MPGLLLLPPLAAIFAKATAASGRSQVDQGCLWFADPGLFADSLLEDDGWDRKRFPRCLLLRKALRPDSWQASPSSHQVGRVSGDTEQLNREGGHIQL